jgi:type I restriction enzyme R subunit
MMQESVVEGAPQGWINSLGYVLRAGPNLAPGEPEAERSDDGQVVLEGRVRLTDLNLTP